MHRCFVSPEKWAGDNVALDVAESHHLAHVLRLGVGDLVEVFDGRGRYAPARIVSVSRVCGVGLRILEPPRVAESVVPDLLLIQAVPKGDRMDWIVEKSVELGVAKIQPVVTERVVLRLDEKGWEKRHERWLRLAIEAARQCGASRIPEICRTAKYESAVAEGGRRDLFVVGALGEGLMPIGAAADEAVLKGLRSAALLIGPEGDLTRQELRLAEDTGAKPVTFGRQVLRVETAALYGVSVLMSAWLTRAWAGGGGGLAQEKSGRAPSLGP